jgi:hypothetical protein
MPPNPATKMPESLAEIYRFLDNQLVWLYAKWNIFLQLFGGEKARVDLLNESAPGFFYVCQWSMWHEITIGLCRLSDREKTGKKENLTLERLVNQIDGNQNPALLAKCRQLLQHVTACCEPFRDLRNRKLAHIDLPTALNVHPEPLPATNRKMVVDALGSIDNLMNAVLSHFDNATKYFAGIDLLGNGDALARCLKLAHDYREEERRRLGLPPR